MVSDYHKRDAYVLRSERERRKTILFTSMWLLGIHVTESPDLQTVNTMLLPRSLVHLYMIIVSSMRFGLLLYYTCILGVIYRNEVIITTVLSAQFICIVKKLQGMEIALGLKFKTSGPGRGGAILN